MKKLRKEGKYPKKKTLKENWTIRFNERVNNITIVDVVIPTDSDKIET